MLSVRRTMLPLLLLAIALALPAAAGAASVYSLSVATSGSPGTPGGEPLPVQVGLGLTVQDPASQRPATVASYSFALGGVHLGGTAVPGCDLTALNDPQNTVGSAACPPASSVGAGRIIMAVGPPSDPTDGSLYCSLSAALFNSTTPGRLIVWLQGGPRASVDPRENCVQDTHSGFEAAVVDGAGGSRIDMTIPANFLHPAGGALSTGVTALSLLFTKPATATGYTLAFSCPTASVTVTPESGAPVTVFAPAAECAPPVAVCPAGLVGAPPTCLPPVPPQEKLPVKVLVPSKCVRGAFAVRLRATTKNPKVGGLVLRLDKRRLKAITRFPGSVTIPASKLKKAGRHTLTVTGAAGGDAHATPVSATFRVCAPKKRAA
jgi:hypothetical protein